jgi:mRNA interferase MazF
MTPAMYSYVFATEFIDTAVLSRGSSYEVAVKIQNSDLEEGNLRFDSYVRVDKIFTIDQAVVLDRIGRLKIEKIRQVKDTLIRLLNEISQ